MQIYPLLAVAAGGAIGACARFAISGALASWRPFGAIGGTLAANVLGCFLIGAFYALAARFPALAPARLFFVTGFLGALTTFSTFSHESLQLLSAQPAAGVANIALNFALCLAAAAIAAMIINKF